MDDDIQFSELEIEQAKKISVAIDSMVDIVETAIDVGVNITKIEPLLRVSLDRMEERARSR